MTRVVPHPAVARNAAMITDRIFAMPLSQGIRAFVIEYLFSTPISREALIEAVAERLRTELLKVREAARLAA